MLWLRQMTIITGDLEAVTGRLRETLGLELAHRDPNVGKSLKIENTMLPVGEDFIEVVAPVDPQSAAARYLSRRGEDGYLTVIYCDDLPERKTGAVADQLRIIHNPRYEGYEGIHIHPKDAGGALLEFNWQPDNPPPLGRYYPAGPHWQDAVRTEEVDALAAVELRSDDPSAMAAIWSRILQRPTGAGSDGAPEIRLDRGTVRFIHDDDNRGPGLAGIHLRLSRSDGVPRSKKFKPGDAVTIGGVKIRLV